MTKIRRYPPDNRPVFITEVCPAPRVPGLAIATPLQVARDPRSRRSTPPSRLHPLQPGQARAGDVLRWLRLVIVPGLRRAWFLCCRLGPRRTADPDFRHGVRMTP